MISSSYRPIDKKLIKDVFELTVFMPNILVGQDMCSGLFIYPYEDC